MNKQLIDSSVIESLGDYAILKQIGEGALGRVFLAEHRFLKRLFVLKVLPEDLTADQEFIARFEKEVASLAALDHPHLVKVHNVSCVDGSYFLVTDCILNEHKESMHLGTYLNQKKELSEEEIFDFAQQVASALDALHEKQKDQEPIVHGALKLSNLLIAEGKIYLSDFGLSKVIGTGAMLSRTYKVLSRLFEDPKNLSKLHLSFLQHYLFLAPEQKIFGGDAQEDIKTDVYAFGVFVYYLLFREFPEGFFELPSARGFPFKLNWDALLCSCLNKDPLKRPSSLRGALEALLNVKTSPKPVLNPQEIVRPEFEADPGAIFHTDTTIGHYQPEEKSFKEVKPLFTEMVVIPGGTFFRGSNEGARDEMPRHAVHLSSFAIDIHPITNEQFVRFLEAMGGEKDSANNDIIRLKEARIKRSGGKLNIEAGYAKHPVVGVTWYGAIAYAKWVGKRLPTEAEWEVAACGATEDALYPTGKDMERSQSNFFSSDTTAVMSYPPGMFGIFDMAGNVYEWCQDWYEFHYYNLSIQEPNDPKGPVQGVYRVLRGGCWKSLKEDLRCAHRHRNNPGTANGTYGFRCAADVSK